MRDCEKYRELISRMIDSELNADELSELHAHLDECEECRMVSAAFSDISETLSEGLAEAPEALLTGVMSEISSRRSPYRRRHFNVGYIAAMAACLALIVFSAARYGGTLFGLDNYDYSASTAETFGAPPMEIPEPDSEEEGMTINRAADDAAGTEKNGEGATATGQDTGASDPEISNEAADESDSAPPEQSADDSFHSLLGESSIPLLMMTSAEVYSGEDLLKTFIDGDDLKRLSELLSVTGPSGEAGGDSEPTYSVVAVFPDSSKSVVDIWVTDGLVICIYNDELVIASASPEELSDFLEK